MRLLKQVLLVTAMLGLVAPVLGQVDTAMAQKKLLAKRAAEADAYRKLAECIKGLQIGSETFVKDFVAESDQIQAAMDQFIRAVRVGQPTYYADGSCEVPAEVTVQRVIQELHQIHTAFYKGDKIKSTDIDQIKETVKKDVIRVVGMGAPREDLPPELPAGVNTQLGGPPVPPQAPIPDLWRQIGPQGRLMAQRAARVDAMRKLVERILGLRVNSNTLVRDFVAEQDTIQTVAQGTLIGALEVQTYYHHDEPIVEVTVEVPVESVITTINALHTRSIRGDHVKGTDMTQMTQSLKTQKFQATGTGIPPQRTLMAYNERMEPAQQMPDWAMAPIRMTGEGVAPAEKAGTPQGKLMAARAAELDAKRRLGEHIKGLVIRSETKVQDFITQYDDIQTQMQGILVGSAVEKTEFAEDGTARVTVSIPGMQVWDVIASYEKVVVARQGQ